MYTTQDYWSSPQPRAREKHPQGLTWDARSNEVRRRPSAPIHSDQKQGKNELPQMSPQQATPTELSLRQKIESLKRSLTQTTANETSLKLENDKQKRRLAWAAFTEKGLRREIETLKISFTQNTANEISLKRENDKQQKRLARAASTENGLRREIETLKESLTRSTTNEESLKQESEILRSLLVQVASSELSLRREMDELKASHARTVSAEPKLKEKIEVLKATLTHALTSERDMRSSARETREEWEKVEKSLRQEINALRTGPETIWNGVDVKGETVASHVEQTIQGNVRTVEDPIALTQLIKSPEGSSSIHVLLDDLALQSLVTDDLNPTPPARSDAFGSSFLPEFTALERATKGLQQAVNNELRAAYAKQWARSSPGSVSQSNTSAARNLRLLVVLWDASGVEELLRSLPSIVGDATPTIGSEDCAICTEEILPEHKIVVEGCRHATCKGCLRKCIGAKLGEKVWPVRCPICMAGGGPERRAQAITRPLLDELVLPATVLSQWTDFELSQFIIPVTCPKCDKSNLFELTEYNRSKILICNHGCECAWCRDCSRKVNIDVPHNCEDEALEELAGERRWMRCPRPSCRVMVEKNVGCHHITCRCGMHFCYLCGDDITGRITQHACRQQS